MAIVERRFVARPRRLLGIRIWVRRAGQQLNHVSCRLEQQYSQRSYQRLLSDFATNAGQYLRWPNPMFR